MPKILTFAILCGPAALFGQTIYECLGQLDDKQPGWHFIPSASPGGQTYHESEGYYPDKGGKLAGPAIPVSEFAYYLLSFDAKAAEDCYWAVVFRDSTGQEIVSDVYSSVYGGAEKRHYEEVVYGREGAVSLSPSFHSVKGVEVWDLKVKKITAPEAAEWCDTLYKTLPPLSFSAPENRRIPKTMEAMQAGRPWRVGMLGDSIVNDTFNSNFQSLLQRQYPKADLKFICSVRGGTGCDYYQDPKHFGKYVKDLRPDLLIIGGVSNVNDIDAVRSVAERARREIGCEILITSGPWGRNSIPAQSGGPDEPDRQRRMAEELEIEFIDMAAIWRDYLTSSPQPKEWFHRDVIHANDRGKQILGRVLEIWFSPRNH